jgi:hypothetical protein
MRFYLLVFTFVLATFIPAAAGAGSLQDCITLKCDRGCVEKCNIKATPKSAAHRRCLVKCKNWQEKCVAKCRYKTR